MVSVSEKEKNGMSILYSKKDIKLTQIVNREQAIKRVLFKSVEEVNDPDEWLKIIKGKSGYARLSIKAVDNTPEEEDENLKKYSILYGLKYLYAACKLQLESVEVTVLDDTGNFDIIAATAFFNADFCSLTEYEKSEFIEKQKNEKHLSLSALSQKSGCPYGTLQSLSSAYTISKGFPSLQAAYKNGLLGSYMLRHSKTFFDMISFSYHQLLTDYLIREQRHAIPQLREAVCKRASGITIPQAILDEISSSKNEHLKASDSEKKKNLPDTINSYNAELSEKVLEHLSDRIAADHTLGSKIREYQNLRQKCWNAYNDLCSVLPSSFMLDFETALTMPDRARFSYAKPKEMKRLPKNLWNKNEIRLFTRMREYLERSENTISRIELIEKTYELFQDYRCQNLFAVFFRYSIILRNKKIKISRNL